MIHSENLVDKVTCICYTKAIIKSRPARQKAGEKEKKMKRYELTPTDGRKSFSGKAVVEIADDGSETLYSYNTPIIKRAASGDLVKLWDGWSATTGRHIAAFCGLNKAAYMEL